MVGQFALAQALSAPVFLTVGLNLRAVLIHKLSSDGDRLAS